ncbi:MAG: hypothetical protein ACOCWC_00060 [Bacteroidota bacterium]
MKKLLSNFKGNFFKLLFATVVGVVFGLVYRVSQAWLFGSSDEFAFYLIMSISLSFFVQIVGQTALEGNLVPDLTKAITNNKHVSFKLLQKDTIKFAVIFGLINFLIVIGIVIISGYTLNLYYLIIALLLGLALTIYIFNSVGLMITQARGDYRLYSRTMIANAIFRGGSMYPLGLSMGIVGVAINKVLSFLVLFFGGWNGIRKEKNLNADKSDIYHPRITLRSFNLISLFLANYYSFFVMIASILFGLKGDSNITNFSYSVAILGLIINTIGKATNTILIRETSINFNLKRVRNFLFLVLGISLGFITIMIFFGQEIVAIIYQRGAFTESDTLITYNLLIKLFLPFIFLTAFGVILQTVLSAEKNILSLFRKICGYTLFSIIAVLIFLLLSNVISTNLAVLIFYYAGSTTLLIIVSWFSYKRLKNAESNT